VAAKHQHHSINVVVTVILVRKRKIDKHQTKLVEEPTPVTVQIKLEPWIKYRCPFCLGEYPIYQFESFTKAGKESKKAVCPECKQTMLKKTLTADMSPVEYGRWLYDYTGYGGYKKISWEKIKRRVVEMGIADTFWTAYKAAKAEKWAEKGYKTDEEIAEAYRQYQSDTSNE
jgi:hypothetical protein